MKEEYQHRKRKKKATKSGWYFCNKS